MISRGLIKHVDDGNWIDVDLCSQLDPALIDRINSAKNWSAPFRKYQVDDQRNLTNVSDRVGGYTAGAVLQGTMTTWLTTRLHTIFEEVQDLFYQANMGRPDRFTILLRGRVIQYDMTSPPRLNIQNATIVNWLSQQGVDAADLNKVTIFSSPVVPVPEDENQPFVVLFKVLPVNASEEMIQNPPPYPFQPPEGSRIRIKTLPRVEEISDAKHEEKAQSERVRVRR